MHAKKRNAKKVQQQLVVMIAAARIKIQKTNKKKQVFEACDFQPGDITSSHNLLAFLFGFFSPTIPHYIFALLMHTDRTNKFSKLANSLTIRGIIAGWRLIKIIPRRVPQL